MTWSKAITIPMSDKTTILPDISDTLAGILIRNSPKFDLWDKVKKYVVR